MISQEITANVAIGFSSWIENTESVFENTAFRNVTELSVSRAFNEANKAIYFGRWDFDFKVVPWISFS